MLVTLVDVVRRDPLEMQSMEDQYTVEALAMDGHDEAHGNGVGGERIGASTILTPSVAKTASKFGVILASRYRIITCNTAFAKRPARGV